MAKVSATGDITGEGAVAGPPASCLNRPISLKGKIDNTTIKVVLVGVGTGLDPVTLTRSEN